MPGCQQGRTGARVGVNNKIVRGGIGLDQPPHKLHRLLGGMDPLNPCLGRLSPSVPVVAVDRSVGMEGAPDVFVVAYVVGVAWSHVASLPATLVRTPLVPDDPGAFLWQARVVVLASKEDAFEPKKVGRIKGFIVPDYWSWVARMDPLNPIGRIGDYNNPLAVFYTGEDIPAIPMDQGYVVVLVGGYNSETFYNRL